jgi:hypothetical protein
VAVRQACDDSIEFQTTGKVLSSWVRISHRKISGFVFHIEHLQLVHALLAYGSADALLTAGEGFLQPCDVESTATALLPMHRLR